MLPHTLQSEDLALLPTTQASANPFEDIAALHALYQPRIFRFLLLSTRDRDLAFTLTQDTFLKVWRTRASFRGDCSAITWITRIAVSLLRSHTRTEAFRFWKRAAASSVDATELTNRLTANGRSAEGQLIAHQSLTQLWQTVEQLSARQRSVFLLRYVEELEIHDIAAAMDLPIPTVKSHLYRALDRIRSTHSATRKDRP